ncbi:TonB-dependent receptor domain-containing protein [Novosphingobium guangzhouense]|uniref:TonB-dependent receptor n=1 Tax=Novosphingobium guangzhouense TaxID=1850347 RepID=A0A2K2FWW2_9SPHN|nr:TonB-dependent receptor [Novosphingobium guangzhouense]PNU03263.1 TonB-dependent receptor [Novosphingobium guangzhouense]
MTLKLKASLNVTAGVLALILAHGTTVHAAEAEAEAHVDSSIVVTAAGFEQKIVDAPASISVVTAEQIAQRPYMTLIDAVRDLEGVDVGETSDKTGQRTISIRGMGPEYTLLLINGKRQNNHGDIYPNSFGGNQFNHIPPLDTIERIEVIRGPASTLYGADALGGVINIITKPVASRWSGSATVGRSFQEDDSFGNDVTFDASLSGPIIGDTLGIALRGSIYERMASNPEFDPVTDPAGVVHVRALGFGGGGRTVDNTNYSVGGTLTFRPTDNQTIDFDYDISRQKYDNTPMVDPDTGTISYPLGTLDGIDSIWRATRGVVQPRVGYKEKQRFNRTNWALTHRGDWGFAQSFVSLAYVKTENLGRTRPFSVAERLLLQEMWDGSGEYANLSEAQRRQIAADTFLPRPDRDLESNQYTLDARLVAPVKDFFGDHEFVVGGQYINGELKDGVFGLEATTGGVAAVQKQKQWSLFAEDNWSPIDPLTVTLGVRYDEHAVFGGQFSPRAYAVFNVLPTLVVKGGISTGFKTPKTTDLYDGIRGFGGQGTSPMIGNPDLEPETSTNTELAVYWDPMPGTGINVTYFQNDFKDKISSTTVQPCAVTNFVRPCANLGDYWEILGLGGSISQPVNIDKARIKGLEVAGRLRVTEAINLRANYTNTDSKQQSGADAGLPLTNTARHMANGWVDWRISDVFSAQLNVEHRSRRYRGVDTVTGEHQYFRSYTVFNLGGQARLNDNITIAARVNNLLNQDFTSYSTNFIDNGDGTYEPSFVDDYNNKDKARAYWVSLNARF